MDIGKGGNQTGAACRERALGFGRFGIADETEGFAQHARNILFHHADISRQEGRERIPVETAMANLCGPRAQGPVPADDAFQRDCRVDENPRRTLGLEIRKNPCGAVGGIPGRQDVMVGDLNPAIAMRCEKAFQARGGVVVGQPPADKPQGAVPSQILDAAIKDQHGQIISPRAASNSSSGSRWVQVTTGNMPRAHAISSNCSAISPK